MTDTPVLKAEHLGISFGGLKAVSDFDIQIGQNELVGLIGPNGAGKTTIFNRRLPANRRSHLFKRKIHGKEKAKPDGKGRNCKNLPEYPSV